MFIEQANACKNISRILFIYTRIQFSESISGPAFICCFFFYYFNCISSFALFACLLLHFGIILFPIYLFVSQTRKTTNFIRCNLQALHFMSIPWNEMSACESKKRRCSCQATRVAVRARKIFRHKWLPRNRSDRCPQQLNIWFSGNVTPCDCIADYFVQITEPTEIMMYLRYVPEVTLTFCIRCKTIKYVKWEKDMQIRVSTELICLFVFCSSAAHSAAVMQKQSKRITYTYYI